MDNPGDLKTRDDPKKADTPSRPKRPYNKPVLTIYGDLRLRTEAMLSGSMADGLALTKTG